MLAKRGRPHRAVDAIPAARSCVGCSPNPRPDPFCQQMGSDPIAPRTLARASFSRVWRFFLPPPRPYPRRPQVFSPRAHERTAAPRRSVDKDRIARFEREAHVLATLNHANIAQIYGLEETGGIAALVMELVDGPTLADRIAQGPIPLGEALPIAKQVAAAHDALVAGNVCNTNVYEPDDRDSIARVRAMFTEQVGWALDADVDLVIGETFWTYHGAFRCTDIGPRGVVAGKLGPREIARAERVDGELRITKRIDHDPSWLNGPPYAVEEVVFDENELLGCFRTEAELLADGGDE